MLVRYLFLFVILLVGLSVSANDGDGIKNDPVVVFLGDSNTWIGGDDCSKPRGWNYWFSRLYGNGQYRSYARSGATWTNTVSTRTDVNENVGVIGDNNVVYNQIERLKEAVETGSQLVPTLILVSAGANDGWFPKKRPEALAMVEVDVDSIRRYVTKPSETITLAGSVVYGCELLRDLFPEARVVLLTPFKMKSVSERSVTAVGDIIEKCGEAMGIEVVRQDRGSGVDGRSTTAVMTYDGNHTNERGAEAIARFVIDELDRGL